jgi:dihydrolipoamide dehydrogenase
MQNLRADAVVIGAGPGGYACAIRLAQLGKKVIVIDAEHIGGVCLNVGCIPSKALIHGADEYRKVRESASIGVHASDVRLDWTAMQKWKDGVVSKLTGGVKTLLKGNKVEVLAGRASFTAPGKLLVAAKDGEVSVEAKDIVIATGSRPVELRGLAFDGRDIVSSTEALSFAEVPKRLVVIGGGYIGLELGIAYRKLGAHVTVIEMMDQLLPGFDTEVVGVLARKCKKLGIEAFLGARAKSVEKTKSGLAILADVGGKEQTFIADKLLVTVGRRPNSEGLGLDKAGVRTDAKGFIPVDAQRRTNVPGIYAIGDVAGEPMLAHKASKEAEVAAEVVAGHKSAFDVRAIPAVVFTDPQIATVGLDEAQARAQGHEVVVAKFPFGALGRALAVGETDGFAKLVSDKKTGLLLGAQIVGPEASDLIAECALALEMGAAVADLALTIHAHPTLAEGVMEAAKVAIGECVHQLPR